MANKLTATELDYDGIKTNLKTFLKNQKEFSDYNFEGSGLAVLMDLLAYNTHYLAMNANMALNESFLDSATLRSSVVSHAKTLGYTPRSPRCPVAYLRINVNNTNLTSLTMDKGTRFTTKVDGNTYGFVTNEDYTITPTNGLMTFNNVPIYEGTLVDVRYTVDDAAPTKRYILTDNRADTTTLKVSVQTSATDSYTETYTLATDITQVSATSKVYFLQEVEDQKFEVYFGDGVVGKKPADGNIIILEYIVTNKTEANGASSFTGSTIGGETNFTVSTVSSAVGGAEAETVQSIKYNAPLDFASQGRAVTTDDYKLIVPKVYADTKSVQVWGGEDNDPPIYGQVYISLKTNSGITLTQAQKDVISRSLDRYNVASVRPTFVDPEITTLRLNVKFKYDGNATTKTAGELQTLVRSAIQSYSDEDLGKFDGIFRYSKLSKLIDNSDSSILSNITTVRMVRSVTPTLNQATKYVIKFNNPLHYPLTAFAATTRPISHPTGVEVLQSTGFKIAGNDNMMYAEDTGNGFMRMYYYVGGTTKNYVDNNIGTVDYETGEIVITSINVVSTEKADGTIDLITKPDSNDIVAVRNQLIEIDFTNIIISGENDTITSGGSSAGTNYATTSSY
jgi:hypothetical protein